MARPSKYKSEYAEQAYKLCLLGATDIQLADFFGVTEKTLANWKNTKPGFLQSLKDGKDIADAKVAESLFQRACGYSHDEIKLFAHEGVVTDERVVTKHYPPDATSGIFWLKNRQRDKWRDKVEQEITGRDGGPIKSVTTIQLVGPDDDTES